MPEPSSHLQPKQHNLPFSYTHFRSRDHPQPQPAPRKHPVLSQRNDCVLRYDLSAISTVEETEMRRIYSLPDRMIGIFHKDVRVVPSFVGIFPPLDGEPYPVEKLDLLFPPDAILRVRAQSACCRHGLIGESIFS